MTAPTSDKLLRSAARKSRKREEKKAQIARSAQLVLQELGYANTSLRDIASRVGLSLGSLHYYFEDRTALIIYCVTSYKRRFSEQLQEAIAGANGRGAVIEVFTEALASSIVTDASTHRLWYDIRGQALFDPAFRPAVTDVERMLIDSTESAMKQAGGDQSVDGAFVYALIDGLFRYHLQGVITGNAYMKDRIQQDFKALLDGVF